MKNFKTVKRESGFKIYEQDGHGRHWRHMENYGPYARKDGAMAMVYKLRSKEARTPNDVGSRIMASRQFCVI